MLGMICLALALGGFSNRYGPGPPPMMKWQLFRENVSMAKKRSRRSLYGDVDRDKSVSSLVYDIAAMDEKTSKNVLISSKITPMAYDNNNDEQAKDERTDRSKNNIAN
jgi:hypothetical protein